MSRGEQPERQRFSLARAGVGLLRTMAASTRGMALDAVAGVAKAGEALTQRGGPDRAACATLRVRVVILSDEDGRPLTNRRRIMPSLLRADAIFRAGAGTRIRVTAIDTVREPAPHHALDPPANRRLLLADILGRTQTYRENVAPRGVLSVVGDSVTVVVVRHIASYRSRGRTTGCSLGMTADWVLCQASLFDENDRHTYDETVLAHELGHALNLPHVADTSNLMSPTSSPPDQVRGTALRRWQAAVIAANRHIVPPVAPKSFHGS